MFAQARIAKGLEANRSIIEIDLSWNHMRGKAGVALSNVLRTNSTLSTLHLGWNGLATLGARAFAESLKVNSTLAYIDLTNNRITVEGGVALGKALEQNRGLEVFRIGTNSIEGAGISAALAAASTNSNLKELDFSNISIPYDVKQTALKLIEPSEALRSATNAVDEAHKTRNDLEAGHNLLTELMANVETARTKLATASSAAKRIVYNTLFAACEARLAEILSDFATVVARTKRRLLPLQHETLITRGPAIDACRDAVVEVLLKTPGDLKTAQRKAREAYRKEGGIPHAENQAVTFTRMTVLFVVLTYLTRMCVSIAVNGGSAMHLMTAVFEAALHPLEVVDAALAAFQSVGGEAYFVARQVFTATRMAHPKDLQKAVGDARDAFIDAHGTSDLDLSPFLGAFSSRCFRLLFVHAFVTDCFVFYLNLTCSLPSCSGGLRCRADTLGSDQGNRRASQRHRATA